MSTIPAPVTAAVPADDAAGTVPAALTDRMAAHHAAWPDLWTA